MLAWRRIRRTPRAISFLDMIKNDMNVAEFCVDVKPSQVESYNQGVWSQIDGKRSEGK